ncbi:hypothetical protein acsn021_38060 [Anaerocolumna cellulosilytica]|uniref:Uncharacterized protein n=1 Tax=Anaerocolumna cellulosilytica TaxID=433286 RepID=A0A6S6R851_9FIRM|nr:hypothetical protein acsn021_38060 [Anaerocolumna cellulosilytica]
MIKALEKCNFIRYNDIKVISWDVRHSCYFEPTSLNKGFLIYKIMSGHHLQWKTEAYMRKPT